MRSDPKCAVLLQLRSAAAESERGVDVDANVARGTGDDHAPACVRLGATRCECAVGSSYLKPLEVLGAQAHF
jgi:hypothetical protein